MSQTILNAYHIMWLFVFFDLPTNTQKERKDAAGFRKRLLKGGFAMMQYSVYVRHCASRESADVHTRKIENFVPEKGQVSILCITDKQYSYITNYWGAEQNPMPETPKQLELF